MDERERPPRTATPAAFKMGRLYAAIGEEEKADSVPESALGIELPERLHRPVDLL
jgi:hypothetical protein